NPDGIAKASPPAVQRWEADSFRVPVANYEERAMVTDKSGYIEGTLPHKMSVESKFVLGSHMLGRQKCRKGQNLKSQMVTAKIQDRYAKAVGHILSFLEHMKSDFVSWDNFDESVCAWIEFAYSDGEHKSLVNFALAGLQFYLPACVGRLKQAWRLAKVWHRIEPPLRVLPLSPLLTAAFAGACVLMGFTGEAAGFLIAFDCMLRSGELYNLQCKDVTFMRDKAVLSLGKSKTGKRTGANEMVVVESQIAVRWLRIACSTLRAEDYLLQRGERFFRKLFHALVELFEVPGFLTVYSLRRGGAAWNFLFHGSMEKTLLRGRWSSSSTRVSTCKIRRPQLASCSSDQASAGWHKLLQPR
ncbi:unnamed protein product, partial [Symbiodinium sp. CCMP2456]